MLLIRAAADGYRKLRSSTIISENLTVQRSLSGKEMRYSISNAIPHNPKSKKHPYENLVKSGFSLVVHMRLSSKEQKNLQKNKPYKGFSRFRTDLSLVGLTCALYVLFLIMIMLHGHPFCYAAD